MGIFDEFPALDKNDLPEEEFTIAPPCAKMVFLAATTEPIGFCTRREDHSGGCTHLVNDRVTHNLRFQPKDA